MATGKAFEKMSYVSAFVAAFVFAAMAEKPYDTQVEYLEAPVNAANKVPYIDTGLYPGNDMGVKLRFTPLRTSDSTICGVQCYHPAQALVDKRNYNFFKWYFGCTGGRTYLSWDTQNPLNADRPTVSVGSTYDVFFNFLNDRNRRLVGVDNSQDASLAIARAWPSTAATNTIYLFAYNNNGTSVGDTGNARIYSAQFTQGERIVKDLIPVRKDGVGYLYDKVSDTLLGRVPDTSPDFTCGTDVAGDAYIEGDITLDADKDWTVRGILRLDAAAVIDLNGHRLTIVGAYGDGTITDTSTGDPGELHFAVPSGLNATSSAILTGNMKVVKEGEGRLALIRAGQTFAGGVVVAAGTAFAPNESVAQKLYSEAKCYWGPSNTTIRVEQGATFDTKGNYDFNTKRFVLAGGTLANGGENMNRSTGDGLGAVELVADSTFQTKYHTHFTASGDPPEKIDLGGYTLVVDLGASSGADLRLPLAVENGTLSVVSGGYLALDGGTSGGSPTVNLLMSGATFKTYGEFSVSNYVAAYTLRWNHGPAPLKVYGTFTPAGVDANGYEYFHGCVMQDGSAIDLSAKSAAWDTTATGWTGTGDADGSRTVTFAENATVTLDLHGRDLSMGNKIVSWSEAPVGIETVTFKFDDETADAGIGPVVTENGIYYGADESTVAIACWTGLVSDDITNPGNWACTNFMGRVVTDGLPGASSAVHVLGDVAIQIPASWPMVCDSIRFDSVRLTADCDWRGIAEWAAAADKGDTVDIGSVDLNGHKLRLATALSSENGHIYDFVTMSVTDASTGAPGELHIGVTHEDSYLECSGFTLSGNLRLVKEGAGWLGMTRPGQTFTGGVFIAEGTGYAPNGMCPESSFYWGPDGGTITVDSGANFDARGNLGFANKSFFLNGGTLANTVNMGGGAGLYSPSGFGSVTLTADSVFRSTKNVTTSFSTPVGTEKIDLRGFTLTVSLEYGSQLHLPIPVENGTLVFNKLTDGEEGGYLRLERGAAGGAPGMNLLMQTSALFLNGTLSVSNYVAQYTGGYNHGAASIKVYGVFTPITALDGKEYFHGCELMNGSTIDLSEKEGPWNIVSNGWSGTGNTDGNRTVEFEDGATVNVELGDRSLFTSESVIDWTDMTPDNLDTLTFRGVSNGAFKCGFQKTADGIYPVMGTMIIFR
ncbi:MAG: hypothetical protein IJU44_09580 [Kiritimatiellae bacterium]|nr:hypothetical protein [Kiritimatiellia bacterium]